MRKIYIDVGAFTGDTIDWFLGSRDDADEFEIFAFEANPALISELQERKGTIYNKAVWTEGGTMDFFIGKDPTGSTLVDTKESGEVDYKNPVHVPCIDFNQWLIDNFDADDYIILKMDIEGAEFEVLPHMIDGESILLLSQLMVEFHPNKVRKYKTTDKIDLIRRIKHQEGLLFKEWH